REQTTSQSRPNLDLLEGQSSNVRILGPYAIGTAYFITLTVDRPAHALRVNVRGANLPGIDTVITPAQAPDLFNAFRPTLTLSATTLDGSSKALIQNYKVVVPSQSSNTAEATVTAANPVARTLALIL